MPRLRLVGHGWVMEMLRGMMPSDRKTVDRPIKRSTLHRQASIRERFRIIRTIQIEIGRINHVAVAIKVKISLSDGISSTSLKIILLPTTNHWHKTRITHTHKNRHYILKNFGIYKAKKRVQMHLIKYINICNLELCGSVTKYFTLKTVRPLSCVLLRSFLYLSFVVFLIWVVEFGFFFEFFISVIIRAYII